jgi:acetyl esterase/lipase
MIRSRLKYVLGSLLLALSGLIQSQAATLDWPDLLNRPRPKADLRIPYGSDPLQFVDLWLPPGTQRHPVVVMVHGGCWQSDIADASIMNYIADDLRAHGIAVWNIEYRGVDRNGGGYPGTFVDVAAAADLLATSAARYHLRVNHLVGFGHSAGGHLALWLAARRHIPRASVLRSKGPLVLRTVISAGGLPDLEAAQTPPGDTCGSDAVHKLTGAPTAQRMNVYRDTSATELMPIGARQILVNTALDGIAPPRLAEEYAQKAARRGELVERVTIPDEGHVELIAPGSAAWSAERILIERTLGMLTPDKPKAR